MSMFSPSVERLVYTGFYAAAAVLSFVKLGLLASLMSTEAFGLYSIAYSAYVYLIYFFSFGANEYVLKKGSLTRYLSIKVLIRNRAVLHGCVSLLLISALLVIIAFYTLEEREFRILLLCVVLAGVTLPFNIYESFFRVSHNLVAFSAMAFCRGGLVVLLILFLSITQYEYALLIESIGTALTVFIAFILSSKSSKGIKSISYQGFSRIRYNGYSLSLSTMIKNVLLVLDKFLVGIVFGSAVAGTYAFSMLIFQIALLGSAFLMNILGPKILVMVRDGLDIRSLYKNCLKATMVLILTSIVMSIPIELAHGLVVSAWFEKYSSLVGDNSFFFVYFSAVLMCCALLFDWVFIAISRERVLFLISLLASCTFLIIFALGIVFKLDSFSIFAAVLSSRLFVLLAQVIYLRSYLQLDPRELRS